MSPEDVPYLDTADQAMWIHAMGTLKTDNCKALYIDLQANSETPVAT